MKPGVKVKTENADKNSADEDEDEDGGRGADHGGSAKAVAKRIYKKGVGCM